MHDIELLYGVFWLIFVTGLIQAGGTRGKILLSPITAAVIFTVVLLLLEGARKIFPSLKEPSLWHVVLIVFGPFIIAWFAGLASAGSGASSGFAHRRGAIVTRALRRSRRPDVVSLAGVPLTLDDETKHIKILGTTGTGKSTAIREILSVALSRGDRAIIADPDGGYLTRFYDPARGDVILNPFDGDAHKWHLFGEIVNDYDVEQLARSMITDGGSSDRSWSEYARTFFCAVVHQCITAGVRDDAELFRLLVRPKPDELRILLAGTSAGTFLEPGNERMLGSIRSIVSSAVHPLGYTSRQQGIPLSVRKWVKEGAARCNGGKGGILFIPYKAGEIAALKSVISAWLRIGIFEAMDRAEGDQRLWFVVDELDALGEIDGLKDALARLRKFGGRCILGFQSIAQVSGTYGRGAAETIVENCGNTLILRCSASERGGTSEFASKLIGQREVVHITSSRTRVPDNWMPSTTTSENLRIEPAVMASEIERLPNLRGFLKIASEPDWQVIELTPTKDLGPARERKPSVLANPPAAAPTPAPNPAATVESLSAKPKRARSSKAPARRDAKPEGDAPTVSASPNITTEPAVQKHSTEAE